MRRIQIGQTTTVYFPPNLFTPELVEAEVDTTWFYRLDQFVDGQNIDALYTLDGSYVGVTLEIPDDMRPGSYQVRVFEPETDQTILVELVDLYV